MKAAWIFVALLPLACGDGSTTSIDDDPPIVEPPVFTADLVRLDSGPVRGFAQEEAIAFKGIPYVAPPVGELRWRPPEPVDAWSEELEARDFPPMCPQPPSTVGVGGGVEDCLYLNVWTPADREASDRMPVMLFLHGGGNFLGDSAHSLDYIVGTTGKGPLYDGAHLSARGRNVVITINYRLGALGFFTHPDLEQESGSSGNYGLMDQIAALEWVQRNAEAFGGDPARVLLFGQSGGGRDVCLLLASPSTEGLFSRAAMHSIPCAAQTTESAVTQRDALVAEMACDSELDPIACMRAQDPLDLVNAEAARPLGAASGAFRPTIDGHIVLDQPAARYQQGTFQHVPIVLGTNDAERAHQTGEMTATQYENLVRYSYGTTLGNQILDQYPASDYPTGTAAYVQMVSDKDVTCPARRLVGMLSEGQSEPVHLYRFRQVLSAPTRLGDGAYHTSELAYLFQHMSSEDFPATDEERDVEAVMLHYWSSFADTGEPAPPDLPAWTPYDVTDRHFLSIEPAPAIDTDLKRIECDFWDGLIGW